MKRVQFRSVGPGKCFFAGNDYFMKLDKNYTLNSLGIPVISNAVNLVSGKLFTFEDREIVLPASFTLNVEP